MLERAAGQMVLAGVALAGLAVWPALLQESAPTAAAWLSVGVLLALGLGALLLFLAGRIGPARLRSAAAGLASDFRRTLVADRAWFRQGLLNSAIVASYIATFALAAAAIGHPLPWTAGVTVVPLVLLSMAVPMTIGGWGVREAVAAGLWPLLGMDAAAGVATSVLYGLIVLIGSLPGAVVPLFRHRSGGETAT